MSLLFNRLPRLVITFLPRSKSLNFMAAVTICSDFGAQKNKVWHCFPIYFPWSDGTCIFILVFSFSWDLYPRVKLLHHMIALLLILWGTSTLGFFFYSGFTNLHSHQQRTWVLYSPHSCQYLFLVFLTVAILAGVNTLIFHSSGLSCFDRQS